MTSEEEIAFLKKTIDDMVEAQAIRARAIRRLSTRNAKLRQILDNFFEACQPVKMDKVVRVLGEYKEFALISDSVDDAADFENPELLQGKLRVIYNAWEDVKNAGTGIDFSFAIAAFANIIYSTEPFTQGDDQDDQEGT